MGGLRDVLFGRKSQLQTTTLPTLDPNQQRMLDSVLQGFESEGGIGFDAGNVASFDGDLSAGLSDRELTSLASLEQQAMNNTELNTSADAALLEMIQKRGDTTDFEDFYSTNVRDPAVRDFSQNVRPAIDRSFGGSSFFSSDRQSADNMASEELIRSLVGSRASLAFQTKEAASNRLLTALGLSNEIQSSRVDNTIKSLDAFGTEREVEQGARDREYNEFVRQQEGETRLRDERARRIDQILQALGIKTKENLGGITGGSTGVVQAFLGGAAGGLGAQLVKRG